MTLLDCKKAYPSLMIGEERENIEKHAKSSLMDPIKIIVGCSNCLDWFI
jgi:hypothetical protein